jgi:phosphoribosylglycinamide formyltransferase 2
VLAQDEGSAFPEFLGLSKAAAISGADFRIFGKPTTRKYRRMGVGLAFGDEEISVIVERAKQVAGEIKVVSCD